MSTMTNTELPGLDCGICGYRTCQEMREQLPAQPELLQRCIHLSSHRLDGQQATLRPAHAGRSCKVAAPAARNTGPALPLIDGRLTSGATDLSEPPAWRDSLGREFDFYLEHFPEEPGPREIILPHNPLITREMDVKVGDILIGRPLGMSCGCPITHCGIATQVDTRTGVIAWCVTGPLGPRQNGYKDLGYYIAEGYEGLVRTTRCELKIGLRYFFQPRMCMLQWRHSGLLNYVNRNGDEYQVRLEGLWIG